MSTPDPVTGPLSRQQLAELASAPFGAATEAIRKHDPLWGRSEGEKINWAVTVKRSRRDEGRAVVQASSQKEAAMLADDLTDDDIDWDEDCDFEIVSVEPAK